MMVRSSSEGFYFFFPDMSILETVIVSPFISPDGAIGCCSGALRSFSLGIMRTSPRVDARYATQALPRYTGEPKTKPRDLWCDLAACFWHFWHFESFVPCITYVFSV